MDDLISRQAAIDALDNVLVEDESCKVWFKLALQQLPSAERRGRWIPDFNGKFKGGAYWFHCSRCGRIVPDVRNGGWDYCPSCGAEMEVVEE